MILILYYEMIVKGKRRKKTILTIVLRKEEGVDENRYNWSNLVSYYAWKRDLRRIFIR